MASWVGTAKTLVGMKDQWQGTLMFIGSRPRRGRGRQAMIDGRPVHALSQARLSASRCMTAPVPTATSPTGSGSASSNSDGLYITFKGRGGHGARPQATIDPVMMAARFIVDVQSVISREKDPTEFGVVTIGAIHAGTAGNIIPDEASVLGTIRSYKPQVRAKMLAGIERTAKAVAAMADAPAPDIQLDEGTKAVVNDPAVVAHAERC